MISKEMYFGDLSSVNIFNSKVMKGSKLFFKLNFEILTGCTCRTSQLLFDHCAIAILAGAGYFRGKASNLWNIFFEGPEFISADRMSFPHNKILTL